MFVFMLVLIVVVVGAISALFYDLLSDLPVWRRVAYVAVLIVGSVILAVLMFTRVEVY